MIARKCVLGQAPHFTSATLVINAPNVPAIVAVANAAMNRPLPLGGCGRHGQAGAVVQHEERGPDGTCSSHPGVGGTNASGDVGV